MSAKQPFDREATQVTLIRSTESDAYLDAFAVRGWPARYARQTSAKTKARRVGARWLSVFVTCIVSHSDIVDAVANRLGCPIRQLSPTNSSGPKIAITASFPSFDKTATLTLTFLI